MNNHYQLYVEEVLNFAETLVIKFDDAAQALNYQVTNAYGLDAVDTSDRTTWKYYQNISGQYHYSDPVMQVLSLDTAELIDFTTENLFIHLATKAGYRFGSRNYKELVQKYPDQELLILGILNPTPIQTAIEARDGQIVQFQHDLVEVNEVTLIPKLQDWIYKYLERWVNPQYAISDDLYVASYIGQLYLHIVPVVMNLRLGACKTNEAHSFHVRQYLASHGGLDVYLDQMTLKQALFFYRNILYIQRHAGKMDTFDWLVENVMTERALPLYEYTMNHNVANMEDPVDDPATPTLPVIEFKRKGINPYALETDISTYSLEDVLAKVESQAPGNAQYHLDHQEDIRNEFAYSPSSVVSTKTLESSITDYSDAVLYTRASILLNHWLGMVGKGFYTANIQVDLPASGETLSLNAQNAVGLYLYAMHKTFGISLQTVPAYRVERFSRSPRAPLAQLLSITERKHLTVQEVQEIYDSFVPLEFIQSIEGFYTFADKVFQSAQLQHAIYASKEDFIARGDAQAAVARLYFDERMTLSTLQVPGQPGQGISYGQFFLNIGFNFDDYSQQDFFNLAYAIMAQATGVVGKPTNQLAQLQKAMVNLFTQLSSYSIQVVSEINASNIVVVERPSMRVGGDTSISTSFYEYVDIPLVDVIGVRAAENERFTVPIADIFKPPNGDFIERFKHDLDLLPKVTIAEGFIPLTPAHIDTGLEVHTDFDFEAAIAAMTPQMRADLVDLYGDDNESGTPTTLRALQGFTLVSNRKTIDITLQTIRRALPEGAFTHLIKRKVLPRFFFYNAHRTLSAYTFVGNRKVLPEFGNENQLQTESGELRYLEDGITPRELEDPSGN